MAVLNVDVVSNGALQLQGAAMNAATTLFVREIREEALDLVDPGSTLRGEVQVEARVPEQPALDFGGVLCIP